MIIHIKYVKLALTMGLMALDCGGPQFVEENMIRKQYVDF